MDRTRIRHSGPAPGLLGNVGGHWAWGGVQAKSPISEWLNFKLFSWVRGSFWGSLCARVPADKVHAKNRVCGDSPLQKSR